MTTIQVQSQLPFDTLLDSLQQLSSEELAQLTQHAARLQAQRRAPSLSEAETELLLQINRGAIPSTTRQRCTELTAKLRNETITAEEQAELTALVDEIEQLNAERLGHLVQLAQLRGVPLDDLMQTLEIEPLSYG